MEADPKLPQSLRDRAIEAMKTWRFAPVLQQGRAVGGKTYADVHLCLVPAGDVFNVGVDLVGNGPGDVPDRRALPAPSPPMGLLQAGAKKFEAKIRYHVEADGRARLEMAELVDPKLQKRHGDAWRRGVSEWLSKRRFKPEIINGTPTTTLMEYPISYEMKRVTSSSTMKREHTEQMAEHAKGTKACRSAAGVQEKRAVAVNSPFALLSGG